MKKHVNIPIFIPHLGCPHTCVFCNQRSISGKKSFALDEVQKEIESALKTVDTDKTEAEIAYFGGSFTGIDFDLMEELLRIAYKYVSDGRVSSIRCSTRPDYINGKILTTLKKYGVKTIELGLQSSDDDVLSACERGHTFADEKTACEMILSSGFSLVGQMMIGLPGATVKSELETARFISEVGAGGARIYPTVVFRDSELCEMTKRGEYIPLSLNDAITRTKNVMKVFIESGVNIIRVGLCSSENLISDKTYFAGPNHESICELCENEIYRDLLIEKLSGTEITDTENKTLIISIPRGCISKVCGQNKSNKKFLMDNFGFRNVKFSEKDMKSYSINISIV
ncbi:MAG: radical SAM protein [Eubacteriales bacterium]|nr:radical SAM protein [Eubacteriales bacterium]